MESSASPASNSENDYFSRREALRRRVAEAARALTDRGIFPTVARVRATLGGGSPNDLAPALKQWKESFAPPAASGTRIETPAIPVQISDLAQELWQRATVAAAIDLKGGPTARALTARTEEAEALRQQVKNLRDQLERESVMYGEQRAQGARHEAIARDALARLEESEARERKHLRELGSARQRISELAATVTQLRAPPAPSLRSARPSPPLMSAPRRRRKATAQRRPPPHRRTKKPAAKRPAVKKPASARFPPPARKTRRATFTKPRTPR
jgi:Plasmid replication region DNA-binding N-term